MADLKVEIPQNSQNILGVATINAPLAKVFEAHVKEELFKKWWGNGNPDISAFEAVDGGKWHTTETADGNTYEFMGSYHEVTKNERIIWTFEFLGLPERGHVALEKMEFKAIDDNTTEIRTTSTYQSVEDRDGMVESGMEDGWRQSIEGIEKVASES